MIFLEPSLCWLKRIRKLFGGKGMLEKILWSISYWVHLIILPAHNHKNAANTFLKDFNDTFGDER